MLVMLQVTDPVERDHTMTKREGKGEVVDLKGLLSRDGEFLREAVRRNPTDDEAHYVLGVALQATGSGAEPLMQALMDLIP